MTKPEIPTQQAIIDTYGLEAPVVVGGMTSTLGGAIAAEDSFCTAEMTARQDPLLRARRFAKMLHEAGTPLHPGHAYLLESKE